MQGISVRGWLFGALAAGWLAMLGPISPVRAVASGQQGSPISASSVPPQRALLVRYCITCHNDRLQASGTVPVSFDKLDVADVSANAELWEKVVRKMAGGVMPPPGRPRPDKSTYDGFISWAETRLDAAAAANPNPGRTETFHRLNRAEYRNVIRDLLALETDVSELLPADDASYGFDNSAGVLKLNPSQMEAYLSVAQKVANVALGSPLPGPVVEQIRIPSAFRQYEHVEGLPFGTRGGTLVRYHFPRDGEYIIKVDLSCGPPDLGPCDGSGGFADPHQLEVILDGERLQSFSLEPRPGGTVVAPDGWQVRAPVRAGPREVGVTFLKPPSIVEVEGLRRRSLLPFMIANTFRVQSLATYQPYVSAVTITGPMNASDRAPSEETPSRHRIFACHPKGPADEGPCAKHILSTLARRAYRRPVSAQDLEGLLEFYRDGRSDGDFEAGIEVALQRLLVSPEFLFRIERDPANRASNTNYRISDFELASRLSFFLWSSIPDDELLDLVEQGKLRNSTVLDGQVRRMLADRRSRALVENFAGQWLQLRNLDSKRPSPLSFPNFDDTLREAFRQETELFFESIIREDRSVVELLTANYTFANERLALHYGMPNVKGSHFRRVTLGDNDPRRGLLGQGSILLVTSHPLRTSPVKRGKWILENILGTPPPDPPANVPPLEEKEGAARGRKLSMRERMAEHRSNPTCAGCHSMIDPAGFALENFDAVGAWRAVDDDFSSIDSSGTLPDGTTFNNAAEFRQALMNHPERFVKAMTEKLLTYALGRGLEYYDMPAVRTITREAAHNDARFSSLILQIVRSTPFQMRRSQS